MATTSDFGTLNSAIYAEANQCSNLVYLIDQDYKEVARQYSEIKTDKVIIAAYALGSRHCLILDVSGNVKKVIRKKKINKIIKE